MSDRALPSQSLDRFESTHSGLRMPKDVRVYAIGDIHGRLDLLDSLHKQIAKDVKKAPDKRIILVYLGDYVDRGDQSSGVIDRLLEKPPIEAKRIFLRGNHEDILLDFIAARDYRERWFLNGGAATVRDYGVEAPDQPTEAEARTIAKKLAKRLPKKHKDFLESLEMTYQVGDVLFVHAGVNPDRPLDDQRPEELMWIREKFLDATHDLGVVVVHGHSPAPEPTVNRYRIGIDTLAWQSGHLTAAVLENKRVRFLST